LKVADRDLRSGIGVRFNASAAAIGDCATCSGKCREEAAVRRAGRGELAVDPLLNRRGWRSGVDQGEPVGRRPAHASFALRRAQGERRMVIARRGTGGY
jgi:hypothetical protein